MLAAALALLGATSSGAHADANGGGIAASLGLAAADGSVRTQAGVRLSIDVPAGAPDRVHAMSTPIQARMPALRECFAQAMLRSPTIEGRAEFLLESTARGSARVEVTADETSDPRLLSCMKKSLVRASLKGVPRGSRALVALHLSNPVADLHRRMDLPASTSNVRMLAGGRAESLGGTQAGDIKFRVTGAAGAARTIAGLQRDISGQLAGLLDCRRKAFRRMNEASGQVELELRVRSGALGHGSPRSTLSRGAPQCVEQWLGKLDTSRLADADLSLAISFSQQP